MAVDLPITRYHDNTLAAAYLTASWLLDRLGGRGTASEEQRNAVVTYNRLIPKDSDDKKHIDDFNHFVRMLIRLAGESRSDFDAFRRGVAPLEETVEALENELERRLNYSSILKAEATDFAGEANGEAHDIRECAFGLVQAGITYQSTGTLTRVPPTRSPAIER